MPKIDERIGEMFMIGFAGTDPDVARDLIQRRHIGGIILFSRNIRNPAQLQDMCFRLQMFRREVSDSPLLIAIDQEGGCVARITEGVTVLPGNMALGAIGSEELAAKAAGIAARELSAMGVNVNFAPVLDLGTNPGNPGIGARSFGADPNLAGRLGAAAITATQLEAVHAAAKHFPGLGEARVDSHDQLPSIDVSQEQLEARELKPFRAAIRAGVSFIMTAHCSYPTLDNTRVPATVSRDILTGLLRERFGFKGVIITDCLEMAGIEKQMAAPQSVLAAVHAGVNMLLICHTAQKQVAAIESLAQAVRTGEIDEDSIERSFSIISSVKKSMRAFSKDLPAPIVPDSQFSQTLAMDAITIVRDEDSVIPLRRGQAGSLAVVVPTFDALTKVEESAEPHEVLLSELRLRRPGLLYRKIPVKPTPEETRECLETCRAADVLLVLTYNLHQYREQQECVRQLLELGKPAIVAAVRDPYDLAFVPKARTCLAAYSFRSCSLKGLVKIVFGESEARGRLPVSLE